MRPETLIPLMVLLPLLAAPAIFALPKRLGEVWAWALFIALLNFAVAVAVVVFAYLPAPGSDVSRLAEGGFFLAGAGWPWLEDFGLRVSFGLDAVSLWLVVLTALLMPITILASRSAVTERYREYYMWLLLLEAAMIGTFIATDVIFFYVCFEFTLVPMFFLIGIFGSTQRLKAARVFFLYTFTGSLLTLAGIIYLAYFNAAHGMGDAVAVLSQLRGISEAEALAWLQTQPMYETVGRWTFDIQALTATAQTLMSPSQQGWLLAALLAGFAVKVPLFPVHTWLPLAHTEAPTAGSVILAGVLLKLGTYGLIRFALPMCPEAVVNFAPYIGVLAVIGILYTALVCWVQKDVKRLIAYSSVSHLGFCVLGLFAIDATRHIGQSGAVMYMVNHGLSTGALFLCIGMIYERFHTRELAAMSGLGRVMPVWAFFFVLFCLASVGLPGLNGFIGEFLTLVGAFLATETLGIGYAVAAGCGMILGAIYILYMVGKVVWGPTKLPEAHNHNHGGGGEAGDEGGHEGGADHPPAARRKLDLNAREITVLTPLAALCLFIGLYPFPMLQSLDKPVMTLTRPASEVVAARVEARAEAERDQAEQHLQAIERDVAMQQRQQPSTAMNVAPMGGPSSPPLPPGEGPGVRADSDGARAPTPTPALSPTQREPQRPDFQTMADRGEVGFGRPPVTSPHPNPLPVGEGAGFSEQVAR